MLSLSLLAASPGASAVPEGVWHCTSFPKTAPPFEVRFDFLPEGKVLRLPEESGQRQAATVRMFRAQDSALVHWTDTESRVEYKGRFSAERIEGALSSRDGGVMEGDFECEPETHSSVGENDSGDFDEERFLPPGTREQIVEPEPKPKSKPKPLPKMIVAPAYPDEAMDEEIEGRVVVCFYVDREGRILEPLIMERSDKIFETPVLSALARSTYRPARDDERPARVHMCRTYKFWLD